MSLLGSSLTLFILQATAIIALSRVFGRAALWAGQPLVVAEMVVGIVLGPSLLGLLAPAAEAALFPRSSLPALGVVSHVGLMLFMFLVGLKLDPRALHGRARASVIISNAGILVPFALGALAAYLLFPLVMPRSASAATFALFLGVSMSVTAFPVVARILQERRLLGSKVGAIVVACAAADDAAAWCLLAFVVAIARSDGVNAALWTTFFAAAFVAVALLVVRPLAAKLAHGAAEGFRATPNLIAAVLCLLLLSSWLTEVIGIHALFGAFMAGAILPRRGGVSAMLVERLEDIVVVFFLPLFFAYSGLRTHIGLLDTPTEWLLCVVVIVIACAAKLGSAALAARLCGLGWRESSAIGVLMNTRGLMELVILNIGLDLEVMSPTVFTIMVIMSLVTTLMTSPLLALLYPAGAPRAASTPAHEVAAAPAPAADYAVLIYVGDDDVPGLAPLARALVEDDSDATVAVHLGGGAGTLTAFARRSEALGLVVPTLSFPSDDPGEEVRALAGAKEASLILLGGFAARPPLAAALMAEAPTTVATLLDQGLAGVRRVLVLWRARAGDDEGVLRLARRFAEQARADITLLHIHGDDDDDDGARAGAAALQELGFQEADGAVYRSTPADDVAGALERELRAHYDLVLVPADFTAAAEAAAALDTSVLLVRAGRSRARPDAPLGEAAATSSASGAPACT